MRRVVDEQVALDHAVIELALLISGEAEAALELRVAREHQRPPTRRQILPHPAEVAVEHLRLLLFHEPLAVGRVRHELAELAVAVEAPHVRDLKAHRVLHARLARVVAGDVDGARVDVAAPDVVAAVELLIHRLVRRVHPDARGEKRPFLRVEAAVKTGRAVLRDERRLDGDRPRTAERVAEGILSAVARE